MRPSKHHQSGLVLVSARAETICYYLIAIHTTSLSKQYAWRHRSRLISDGDRAGASYS
jgi:hypothetical protein